MIQTVNKWDVMILRERDKPFDIVKFCVSDNHLSNVLRILEKLDFGMDVKGVEIKLQTQVNSSSGLTQTQKSWDH